MAIEESTFFRTVPELAAGLRDGSYTSLELTRAYLDRAEELDVPPFELPSEPREDHQGKLATMVTIARDHALEAAERADRELAAGNPRSILHGIPYGVKDLLDTPGHPHDVGVGHLPGAGAGPERRGRSTGWRRPARCLMAKNSLGEFAGGNTSSALNPWKLDRTSFRILERDRFGGGRGPDRIRRSALKPEAPLSSRRPRSEPLDSVPPSDGSAASDAWRSPGASTRSVR